MHRVLSKHSCVLPRGKWYCFFFFEGKFVFDKIFVRGISDYIQDSETELVMLNFHLDVIIFGMNTILVDV